MGAEHLFLSLARLDFGYSAPVSAPPPISQKDRKQRSFSWGCLSRKTSSSGFPTQWFWATRGRPSGSSERGWSVQGEPAFLGEGLSHPAVVW